MSTKVPQFKAKLKPVPCIELDGERVLVIGNLEDYYAHFGFTKEMAQRGAMPDEYIWELFFQAGSQNCRKCYQLHIIRYLLKQADCLAKNVREKCSSWEVLYALVLYGGDGLCSKPGCVARKNENNSAPND